MDIDRSEKFCTYRNVGLICNAFFVNVILVKLQQLRRVLASQGQCFLYCRRDAFKCHGQTCFCVFVSVQIFIEFFLKVNDINIINSWTMKLNNWYEILLVMTATTNIIIFLAYEPNCDSNWTA